MIIPELTILDFFAAGCIGAVGNNSTDEQRAKRAYELAAAMVKERNKKHNKDLNAVVKLFNGLKFDEGSPIKDNLKKGKK